MPTSRRLTLIIAVLVLVDQLTKSWVVSALSDGHVVHLVGSLQFSLGYNSGIAFSQAQGMGVLVAVVALVAVVLLVRAMLRARTPWSAYGLALIASGALGNLADRAFRGDGLLDGHVVDFIDLHSAENRKLLYDKIKEEMSKDRAKHNILPPSKFGLVQITRQRVRPEMNVVTVEKCPTCGGTGEIQASILLVDQIENNLRYILTEQNEKSVTLCVHPYLEAYLTKGWFNSIRRQWQKKFKGKIIIRAISSYTFMEYHFLNKNEDEIKI